MASDDQQGTPAESGPPAPPQYSADGRWWWDGSKWLPVQWTPLVRRSTRPMPSTRAVVVYGIVLGVVLSLLWLAQLYARGH